MRIDQLPTPVYVIDENMLEQNLEILAEIERASGAKILLAQKAFSAYSFYPLISKYLSGTTASGLYEAKLAAEHFKGENHVYCPAYLDEEFDEITKICDHVVFNSFNQLEKFADRSKNVSIGLRLNPEFSTQSTPIYDPCASGSRLGITRKNFKSDCLERVDGFHIHTLCEQGAEDLDATVCAFERSFGEFLKGRKWLNLGGGHHITKSGYNRRLLLDIIKRLQDKYGTEIYLEPGEAIALNAGYLITTVLEIVENGISIAICDCSAECHMPDVIEMPYRPPLFGSGEANEKAFTYRISSRSCLAGDVVGDYSFDKPLEIGDRLIFGDMAIYTMVKNNTFNGMPLPSIAKIRNGKAEIVKTFGYSDFKSRL